MSPAAMSGKNSVISIELKITSTSSKTTSGKNVIMGNGIFVIKLAL